MRLRKLMALALLLACVGGRSVAQTAPYEPSAENLRSRAEFADMKFGIFLHWGIYSMFPKANGICKTQAPTATNMRKPPMHSTLTASMRKSG